MALVCNPASVAWRMLTALALLVGISTPLLGSNEAAAQEVLPATAAAAPESTVLFHTLDLDFEGAQWQQTEELLSRVGVPNALETARSEMLSEGAANGDFSEADLDALIGNEMAIIVTPQAVERFVSHHMAMMGEDTGGATPEASGDEEGHGVAAVLLPGDPDAAWAYAERQVNTLADQLGVEVQTSQEGAADLIWIEGMEPTQGDSLESDDPFEEMFGEHGKGSFAAGRDGNYIIAAMTPADVTTIVDVIDGTTPSLADSEAAQDIASRLPGDALSFTYLDLKPVIDAVGPGFIASMQNMAPSMPQEAWEGRIGLTLSADVNGFRADSIATLPEGADLDALLVDNSQAIVDKANEVPAGTFIYEAGILPPNALAGLPFTFAQAVNGTMSENPMMEIPSAEEIEAEIAKATETLGFNPATDLFDLLGDEFIMFFSFPTFSGEGMGFNGVAAVSTSDSAALSETMRKIVEWVGKEAPEANVSEREVDGGTVYTMRVAEEEGVPAIEFGIVDDQAVFAIGSGIEELQTPPAASLADDAQFQEVMGTLPAEFNTVAYLDIGQAIAPIMMLTGNSWGAQIADADPACADFTTQEEAQTALDEDPVSNANLDLDYDGLACGDAFSAASATPAVSGSLENIRAFAMVGYRQDDAAGSSAILYIAEPES